MEKDKPILEVPIGTSTVADTERRLILATIEHFEGDKMRAALALGLCLKTVYTKLNRYQKAA